MHHFAQRRMRAQFVVEAEPGADDALGVVPVREVAQVHASYFSERHSRSMKMLSR